ncbi:hypothetical protein HYV73_00235 [Candidatus Uhrbacteria bacterium]|nr:hypothetical protein [Candidatus Uhrbacteria bacterium]
MNRRSPLRISDIGTNLWEDGAMGVFEDDKAVIVGTDVAFSFASGGIGDLRVADEIEVIGNAYIGSDAADTVTFNATVLGGSPLVFEGATVDAFETTFAVADPTADRTITFPNASGTVAVSATSPVTLSAAGDIGCATCLTSGGVAFTITDGTTPQTISNGDTMTFVDGTDINVVTSATDTVTVNNTSTLASVTGRGATTAALVNLDGGMAVDTSNFTVSGTTGDVLTAGDLTVNGNTAIGNAASDIFTITATIGGGTTPLTFEGAVADANETTFAFIEPTADRTITFKDGSGTVAFTSDITGSAWSVGANGLFYNTAAVIVGSDSAFSYASGGAGDLRVADELEVIGQAQFGDGIRFRSSTPTWQFVDAGLLAWSDGTNNLLQARDINTNFGLAMNAGAFIDRNSKIEEEFSKKRTTITVDTTGASGTGLGDGGGWGAYENANCTFTSTNDAINGIVNIANTGSGNGCLLMMDDALNNARSVLDADNLPVMLMKLRPNNTGANFYAYAGMADSTDGLTAAPTNFIGFSTEGSTTWAGVTISGGTQTTVACAGQTVSTSQYALMMVEVRSTSDVHFFIDPDVSDGVAFTECDGGSSTNIPTISLAPMFHWQSRSGGASGSMDVDFFRAWQDDNEQTPEAAVADAATPEGAPADAEDLTPAQTDLGIDGMKESWELKKVTADFSTGSAMTQMFPSDNTEIPEGTIVSLTGEGPKVEPSKLAADDLMVGVVTKTSGVEVSNGTFDGVRVAITGRVSVRASAANGIIHVGDYLTSSGKNGVAVKAGVGSPIIGRAMSEYDGEGEGNVVLFLSASAPWGGTSALVSSATEAEGSLVVSGSLLLGGGLELDQVGSATSPETIVYGDLLFGKAAANIDTAGFAAVAQGQRSVRVDFAEPYLHDPSVNITLSLESGDMGMDSIFGSGLRYIVTNKSKLGFNISIDVDAPQELNFSWIALAVKDGNISRNNGITNGRAPSAEADPVHRTEPEAESVPAEAETSGFEEPLSSEDEAEVPPSEEPGSSSAEQDPAQEEPTPIEPAPDAATTDDAAEVVPVVEDVPVAVPVIEAPPTPAPEAPAPEEAPAELVAP